MGYGSLGRFEADGLSVAAGLAVLVLLALVAVHRRSSLPLLPLIAVVALTLISAAVSLRARNVLFLPYLTLLSVAFLSGQIVETLRHLSRQTAARLRGLFR
jgi:hypothetical protein